MILLRAENVSRHFEVGPMAIKALQGVDLTLSAGEMVVLLGRSGAGKTTLLSILAGIDRPNSGRVVVDDVDIAQADEETLTRLRRTFLSLILQSGGLIPVLTAIENVEVPLRIGRVEPGERQRRAEAAMESVQLAHRSDHLPEELSGGEQQRVAIARALVSEPRLLLADEPTGQLDSDTGGQVMRLIRDLVDRTGIGAFVATHDVNIADLADRVLVIDDGNVAEEKRAPSPPA